MTGVSLEAARASLAPNGKLRAGINYSNFLIVQRNAATGALSGIAPDLAHEVGRRLGVSVELVAYESPSRMGDDAPNDRWDIAFLGAEPQRAAIIAFTAAYLEIPSSYLVQPGSTIRSVAEVDREGVRIAVAARAAYDLWLERNIQHAKLERAQGIEASADHFINAKCDALAGLKPALLTAQARVPGSRVLEGQFTAVQQAIGTPRARTEGAAWLATFAEDVKRSGLVQSLIDRHRIAGVNVAPLAG